MIPFGIAPLARTDFAEEHNSKSWSFGDYKTSHQTPRISSFPLNRGSNCRPQALTYSAVANSVLAAPRFRVRVLKSI